jgi:CheY-like chemotaxis protein
MPRQVLIVEDEALVALTLEAMVQDIGHLVSGIATNARDAVTLTLKLAPDVVIMDVRLGTVGDEGIAAAVAIATRTSARIVFVTAYADRAMIARINAAVPAARVLAKPIDAPELAQVIEEVMRGS